MSDTNATGEVNAVNNLQLVRPMDAARELNVNPTRLYGAIRRGTLRSHKFGGATLVDMEDVKEYIGYYGRRLPFKEVSKSA